MGTYGYAAPEYVMTGRTVLWIKKTSVFLDPSINVVFVKWTLSKALFRWNFRQILISNIVITKALSVLFGVGFMSYTFSLNWWLYQWPTSFIVVIITFIWWHNLNPQPHGCGGENLLNRSLFLIVFFDGIVIEPLYDSQPWPRETAFVFIYFLFDLLQ